MAEPHRIHNSLLKKKTKKKIEQIIVSIVSNINSCNRKLYKEENNVR